MVSERALLVYRRALHILYITVKRGHELGFRSYWWVCFVCLWNNSYLSTISFPSVYAAYGGIFIIMALAWGWLFERIAPDIYDILGSIIAIIGVIVIFYMPRKNGGEKSIWANQNNNNNNKSYSDIILYCSNRRDWWRISDLVVDKEKETANSRFSWWNNFIYLWNYSNAQPSNFGRVYAAYGGIFVVSSIIWGS